MQSVLNTLGSKSGMDFNPTGVTGRKELIMKEFVKEIEPGAPLYRDSENGIAWAEDHRTGLGVSVHPNIDASGSIEGMVARGYWRRDDRIARSHGWIYNIDRLAYNREDSVERVVAEECMCESCQERRAKTAYECPICHNTEHLPGAKFCMICGEPFPLSKQGKV